MESEIGFGQCLNGEETGDLLPSFICKSGSAHLECQSHLKCAVAGLLGSAIWTAPLQLQLGAYSGCRFTGNTWRLNAFRISYFGLPAW